MKKREQEITCDCLLDEGSDTSYVNEDVVEALGLQGTKTKLSVKVANDETISFMSSTFEIGLESMDGRVNTGITVQSSKTICGGMKPVNWIQMKHNWQHLKNIPQIIPRTDSGYSFGSGLP